MSETLSYVFCLVQSPRRPALRGASRGMPAGGEFRVVELGDRLWAIVQSVPVSEYGEAVLATGLRDLDWVAPRAIAHERVVESFLSAPALLPMQLFTLFTSDARLLEHVRSARARIRRILKRVERKVEFGLRLTWDERVVRTQASARRARTGAEFLARKRDVLDVNRTRLAHARKTADRLFRSMGREAFGAHRRTSLERAAPGARLLLDAAFLVDAGRKTAFKSAFRQHARTLRGTGINVSLSGPWPPYNFIQ